LRSKAFGSCSRDRGIPPRNRLPYPCLVPGKVGPRYECRIFPDEVYGRQRLQDD